MFAAFGAIPEVQQEQLKRVQSDYLNPAIANALKLGFSSELGLALCFDIHVQNGSIKTATMAQILPQIQQLAEDDSRKIVANAVADSARLEFQEDVLRRILTIANGMGSVHGRQYVLEKWGLSGAFGAVELNPTALGVTGIAREGRVRSFQFQQISVEHTLRKAMNFLARTAAGVTLLWPVPSSDRSSDLQTDGRPRINQPRARFTAGA